jgi:putative FmdB family regulatory protein
VPIYEYRCTNCGHRTDILHGINQPGPNFCPDCGAERTMRKTISAPSVHFKGSGWAKRDRAAATRTKAAAKSEAVTKSADEGSKSDGPSAPAAASAESATAAKPAAPAPADGD